MERHWSASAALTVVMSLTSVTACDPGQGTAYTERKGAITSGSFHFTVPAYWPGDSNAQQWQDLCCNTYTEWDNENSFIISGPNSAAPTDDPSSPLYIAISNNITQAHDADMAVFGYVNINRDNPNAAVKTPGQVNAEIQRWSAYALDGIFFDDAERNDDTDLATEAGYEASVLSTIVNPWIPARVVFNWGAAGYVDSATGLYCAVACPAGQACCTQPALPQYSRPMPRYVDCMLQKFRSMEPDDTYITGVKFVTHENNYTQYTSPGATADWNASTWNWVNQYPAQHFVHLVWGLPQDTDATSVSNRVQSLLTLGAARNAAYFFYTDQAPVWVSLPEQTQTTPPEADPLWQAELDAYYYQPGPASFPGASSTPQLPPGVTCPN